MWKQLLELIKKVIALTRATEENASAIADLREEMAGLRNEF